MATSTATPYELLGAKPSDDNLKIRSAYRARIHDFKKDRKDPKNRKITPEKFRLICRAYETLCDPDKRKRYDQNKEWVSNLPLAKYTLQQLAIEPDLASELKSRLQNATLRQINAQDPVTGHTPLYCAARACNVEAVNYLTEQGAEPNLAQSGGSTALHVGAFYGHPEMVRCMLENGANYKIKNAYNNLAEQECSDNDVDVKRAFIDLKKEPFIQAAADQLDWFKSNIDTIPHHIDEQYYRQRQTLLHCACKNGFYDLAHWLIKKRSANLDIVDINLNSALHLAAYGGHESIVKYLLERGANPLLINKYGMTAEQEGIVQEGIVHGKTITKLFQSMRERSMFEMAEIGLDWWFKYYFNFNLLNTVNHDGVSLLYVACRYGKTSVAKWLLENGANVNVQQSSGSRSTPLHSAAYNGHLSTVQLLLEHGADVNIKNQFGETVFENARSNEMKELLKQYRKNLKENKLLTVHLYGDGKSTGNEPLAKIQLRCDAGYNELIEAMPDSLRKQYNSFSIARRPLQFDEDNVTVLTAACRARYGKTKFVELPLCITAHERPRYMHCGHVAHDEVCDYNLREFQNKFISKCKTSSIKIKANVNETQTFNIGNYLSFTFAVNCVKKDVSIEIAYIFSPNVETFHLPACVCLFQTKNVDEDNLNEMPIVSFNNESNAHLYSWVKSSPYWFEYKTRRERLPFIGGVHAFVRHANVIPAVLNLPPDMFIPANNNQPFISRTHPIPCQSLKIREHNSKVFPHIAYHGTSIKVIPSILMDGLVMPSTVVSSGVRVCPPDNHIARGEPAFDIPDFSNGIFLSPSIHYCTDPVYAIEFWSGDQSFLAVLECSVKNVKNVKNGSFSQHPSTVPGYKPHPDDDVNALEWRLTNPADFEIISILFIPAVESKKAAARMRANKLGVDPNVVT